VTRKKCIVRTLLALASAATAFTASAQVPYPPQNWVNAPTGAYWQAAYPYPGQCVTAANAPFGNLPVCTLANAPSFACDRGGTSNQTAASWGSCGSVTAPTLDQALLTGDTQRRNKYAWEALNPLAYTADTTTYQNADYYVIGLHESWGFNGIAQAGLFPNPGFTVPNGKQWTGVTDASGNPLLTPIWGVGQINMSGGPVTAALTSLGLFTPGPASSWSANGYVATWPSISIRGTTGRPVVVKYVNEFPNNHLYCPHPEAADWPCAIDRTFMGVKFAVDPQKAPFTFQNNPLPYDGVNQYGSPMQPDNSWVTHLHGGEIPPTTDGFAEKWFGNINTGRIYSPQPWPLDPAFGAPHGTLAAYSVGTEYSNIFRPGGSPAANALTSWYYDTYAYPMVNHESTIWFHDHSLGKTHHNVVAGPAGFFPVKDPSKHLPVKNNRCTGPRADSCEYTWVDVLTESFGDLNIPNYDLFFAIQDRDFNGDGTINFPNQMASVPAPPAPATNAGGYSFSPGNTSFVPGPNPQVHPVWVPEYFASNALVNGVIWPKKTVIAGNYRIRLVDGSDARCYNLSFTTTNPWVTSASGAQTLGPEPTNLIPFTVIANEQGYLPKPVTATSILLCPGERYEFVFNFTGYAGQSIYLLNDAPAPYPDGGNGPFVPGSPYPDMATIMRFDVVSSLKTPISGTNIPPVPTCASPPANLPASCLYIPPILDSDFVPLTDGNGNVNPAIPISAVRNLYLNERIDGTTGASLGLQINGVPFEYEVTETPKKGTYEVWNIINTTVDAHPIHPHLVRAQIVRRQNFDVYGYKLALCLDQPTDNDCTIGPSAGTVQQLTVDPAGTLPGTHNFLLGAPQPPSATESGWKDAMRALPGQVLTFVAYWDGTWNQSTDPKGLDVTAPGSGNPNCYPTNVCTASSGTTTSVACSSVSANAGKCGTGDARTWVYPAVTSGPYVWHCHINSHEDSEMMRTSLVVK